jgi:fatty-acyl-CoA synthase
VSAPTLPAVLAGTVARHPDDVAIRFEGRSTTYSELAREARRVARGLVGAGVVKGAKVGLLMGNRPEWVASAFGVWMAGGVLVPVSTFATPAERAHVLAHADVSVLVLAPRLLKRDYVAELAETHPAIAGGAPGRLRVRELPCLRRVIALDTAARGGIEPWASLDAHAADVPEDLLPEVTEADDAVIVYTSGTTRAPKAVLHAHRAPATQALHFARSMGLSPDDRLWTTHPLFWVAGMAVSLGATIASGATLILEEAFEPGAALARIASERATVLRAWRHQEHAMAEHPDAQRVDLRAVTKLNFSSPLARAVGLREDRWGTQGGYGLTETFTVVSDLPATAPAELRAATNGRPLPGMEVRIVDRETGQALPLGVEGEIAVRGRTLMRGYYKTPPEEVFDAEGFFRTGDSGILREDGGLVWTGRLSGLIKTGGANVSPLEVEAAACAASGVRTAVALGVPHPTLGEIVVLCVAPEPGKSIDEGALVAALRRKLAPYKVPKHVVVLEEAEIPRTGTAKVRTGVLRETVLERLALR